MKVISNIRFAVLSILLSSLVISGALAPAASAQTQESGVALQRGFRTGYSDGYMAGYRDSIDAASRSYTRHSDYSKADRAFSKDYGTIEDYRDGYQQGFESGYDTGYDRRSFEASLPADLRRRGVIAGEQQDPTAIAVDGTSQTTQGNDSDKISQTANPDFQTTPISFQAPGSPIIIIPCDTELIVELQQDLNTEQSREGDKFTAKIVSPSEIAGASIEGRVSKVLKPGRIKRRSEMLLSFDRIILTDNRWSNFSGILIEVLAVKGDNVSRIDNEGTAIGRSSIKQDAVKVGGATGAGLVVGAVVGGPVGAAVGAGMGAAFGVGAVVVERGKQIRLNRNQQLRIKTSHEAQIR